MLPPCFTLTSSLFIDDATNIRTTALVTMSYASTTLLCGQPSQPVCTGSVVCTASEQTTTTTTTTSLTATSTTTMTTTTNEAGIPCCGNSRCKYRDSSGKLFEFGSCPGHGCCGDHQCQLIGDDPSGSTCEVANGDWTYKPKCCGEPASTAPQNILLGIGRDNGLTVSSTHENDYEKWGSKYLTDGRKVHDHAAYSMWASATQSNQWAKIVLRERSTINNVRLTNRCDLPYDSPKREEIC